MIRYLQFKQTIPVPMTHNTPPRLRSRRALTAAIVASLVAPLGLWANGSRLPNQDAVATARGDAFVATADSAAAVFYNPAGLTQLNGPEAVAGAYVLAPEYEYEGPIGSLAAKDETHVVPHAYFGSHQEGSRFAWGAGFFAPFGLSTDWGTGALLNTFAARNEIEFLTGAIAGAYQVSDTLSVGAAIHFNDAQADFAQDTGLAAGSQSRFIGDDQSVSGSLGFLWQVAPGHFVGGRYSLSTHMDFKGTFEVTPLAPASPASLSLAFPDNFVLSYAYRPTEKLNIEASVDWTNWDRVKSTPLHNSVMPLTVVFDWDSSFYYDLGISYVLDGIGATVHGGFVYSEVSTSDAVFSPSLPDDTRRLLSVGLEKQIGPVDLTLTLQHGFKTTRHVSGSPVNLGGFSADGAYTSTFNGGAFSLRWHF